VNTDSYNLSFSRLGNLDDNILRSNDLTVSFAGQLLKQAGGVLWFGVVLDVCWQVAVGG
jgi:hypothetical protein